MLYFRSFNHFIFICLTFLISSQAHAAIVGFTDNGSFTTDSFSGLDWLDVTETAGRAYDDISTQFGIGGDFEGWRYATGAEVSQFWDNAGGTAPYDGFLGSQESWVKDLVALWGETAPPIGLVGTIALTADIRTVGSHLAASLYDYDPATVTPPPGGDFADIDALNLLDFRPDLYVGSALVRQSVVPIPAAIWLFGTALMGLVGFGKRKKAA